ncbi:MAG: 50S ribosomal protein L15 [bacterium]
MKLSELKKITKKAKRVGRGIGSRGAKSGRGMKGQRSRAGYTNRAGFEGGQTPLYQRLPKGRGVKQVFASQAVRPAVVKVAQLNRFDEDSIVGIGALKKAGLVAGNRDKIKLVGGGEMKNKLTVRIHACSAGAKEAVEKAGGKVELIHA